MLTTLPSINEYQEALQNPNLRFKDPLLKSCQVEKDPFGIPRVRSGGFALTYCLQNGNRRMAVRCFHKQAINRDSRYAAICRYISSHKSDVLIPVEYKSEGILIKGNWYPIVTMEWIEGDSLTQYIYKNIGNPPILGYLPDEFFRVASELNRLEIAHGDLSHLNILVRNGKFLLIDYDGMYVPELKGQTSAEIGNRHFQHPGRNEKHFNTQIDRFSEIVIYLSLKGIALSPKLYQEFAMGGEALLLRREDFTNPFASKILSELEKLPGLKNFVQQFRQVCLSDFSKTPKLSDLIENKPVELPRSEKPITQPVFTGQFMVFDAANRGVLLENDGEYITVVGKIIEVKQSNTRYGLPYAFFNFGDWRQQCFTVVMWSEVLDLLNHFGKQPNQYWGKWISVTGLISTYDGGHGPRPQIILNSPTEFEVLTETDARRRLSGQFEVVDSAVAERAATTSTAEFRVNTHQAVTESNITSAAVLSKTNPQPGQVPSVNPNKPFPSPAAQVSSSGTTQPLNQPASPQSPISSPVPPRTLNTSQPSAKPQSGGLNTDLSSKLNQLYAKDRIVNQPVGQPGTPAPSTAINKKTGQTGGKWSLWGKITQQIQQLWKKSHP